MFIVVSRKLGLFCIKGVICRGFSTNVERWVFGQVGEDMSFGSHYKSFLIPGAQVLAFFQGGGKICLPIIKMNLRV